MITGLYSAIIFNTSNQQLSTAGTKNKGYHHAIATTLFYHTISFGNRFTNVRKDLPISGKSIFKDFNGIIQQREQQLLSGFINYKQYSNTLLIQLRQLTLLYPFHCFT
jgi:hypothetical protein